MLSKFSITQEGESHKKHGLPCQDSSCSFAVPTTGEAKFVVAIVADGVGSEDRSDEGSKTAVGVVGDCLKNMLAGEVAVDDIKGLIEDAFETALEALLDLADEKGEPFSKFATTLTVAVYDGSTLWYGHAGDDGIVVMRNDGSYGMVTERHEGELANSVIPFGVHHWQFGEEHDVASCVLMTDGILDYCVRDELEDNRVKLPFLEPLLYAVLESDDEVDAVRQDWEDFLGSSPESIEADAERVPVFRDIVKDDLSLALLSNSDSVARLPEYSFDIDAWKQDSERYNVLREEALEELDRRRLAEDSAYRELVRRGKEREPRVRRQISPKPTHGSAAQPNDVDIDSAERNARLPVPPDGYTGQATGPTKMHGPRVSLATGEDDEWSHSMADGACTVMRGISIIGEALGDAVQNLLRKP